MNNLHNETKMKMIDMTQSVKYPKTWTKIYFKSYPRFEKISLPKPRNTSVSLTKTLMMRKSSRSFSTPISINDLSDLLFYGCGITNNKEDLNNTRRSYPSAGARYPLELYVIINNVSGLSKGIYHYDVLKHQLEFIRADNKLDKVDMAIRQNFILDSSVIFLVSGVLSRTQVKYGVRGYRYVLIEAGHVFQNIHLVAESLGIGCCAIGGFDDDILNQILDLGDDEQIVYAGVIGK